MLKRFKAKLARRKKKKDSSVSSGKTTNAKDGYDQTQMDKLFEIIKTSYNNMYNSHKRLFKCLNGLIDKLEEMDSMADQLNINDEAKVACHMGKKLAKAHLETSEYFMYYAAKLYGQMIIRSLANEMNYANNSKTNLNKQNSMEIK